MTAPVTMVTPGVRAPSRRVVVLIAAATAVLVLLALLGIVLNAIAPSPDRTRLAQLLYDGAPIVFLAVGGLLAARRPGNVTAWALWVLGALIMTGTLSQGMLNDHAAGIAVLPGSIPWAAWLNNTTWMGWFLILFVLLLHFPDGRLPGRFWLRLEPIACLDAAVCVVVCAGVRADAEDYPGITLPVDLGQLSRLSTGAVGAIIMITFALMIAATGATAVGLGLRFRRARGVERAQLKWLFLGAGFAIFVLAALTSLEVIFGGRARMPAWLSDGGDVVQLATLWTLPVAVAVAVMRYGLYEIDRIVSRTVSYAVVVAVLAGAYVGVVAGVSALVPDRFGSVAVVLATLAASALFLPVRRRVIGVVDRRFNRSRYDAAVVVAQFAERVRGRAGAGTTGTTGEDLVAAARQVLQPAHASVWLAPGGRR